MRPTKSFLSLAATAAVIVVLVLAAPAQAVTLSTAVSSNGGTDSEVSFSLRADIAAGERIPVNNVTLVLSGPSGQSVCVFATDGTPISGCEQLSISVDEQPAATQGERYGAGWDGTADVNTTFGFGYGYGADTPKVLAWDVAWDTTGLAAGQYAIDYYINSASASASRMYKLKSVQPIVLADAELRIKQSFPKGTDYAFVCDNDLKNPVRFDWDFGDGTVKTGVANKDAYHRYSEPGTYEVTCTARNSEGSASSSMQIVVAEGAAPGHKYSALADAPLGCVGGEMTSYDVQGACRTVTCENGEDVLTVKACGASEGKPKSLKLQQSNPNSGMSVCFGDECPSD